MKTRLYIALSLLGLVFLSACGDGGGGDGGGGSEVPVIDNSFNIGSGMNDTVLSIAPATDDSGDVYVGGDFTTVNNLTSNRLVRMNSDGTVDTDFNIGTGMNSLVRSIAPATDGSGDVYVGGGFSTFNSRSSSRLVRINRDGTVDDSFNIGSGVNGTVLSIAPATDDSGDVYVGGGFTTVNGRSSNRLVRMNKDGTVDTDFNIGTGMSGTVFSIAPATDDSGDVYVGGVFTTVNGSASKYLVRMNNDGTVDADFNIGTGLDSFVRSIAPATDGSGDIYVGGDFNRVNDVRHNHLVRMNSDGTVDTGFNIGTGMNKSVRNIAPATDGSGDVYVGGFFFTLNDVTSNRLVRMNSDGTVDDSFNIGTGMDGSVYSIALATDGSGDAYVGGDFTTVNTIASNRLVGMNPDGTVE